MPQLSTTSDRSARSHRAFEYARTLMPGGVSSPVRAYRPVGREPVFMQSGRGCRVTDIDGGEYIDYVGSYGPLIVGHAHPRVVEALSRAIALGVSFGMPTEQETRLARMVVDAVASVELVRFVNSGTEATMSAIRLARAATTRYKIVKFVGCYHGHSDGLLVEAGSGATTLGVPSSPGVPTPITDQTVLVPFNDLEAVRRVFAKHGRTIAAVIVEPIAGNMGCIPPRDGFLEGLREQCDEHEALLIFDEVMTGFRVAYGGAQEVYGVTPDLTCLGKVIGGGLPCAAYGGAEELMRQVAPDGPVYQAGTLSGNPLAMRAGAATLETLQEPGVYDQLDQASTRLVTGLHRAAAEAGVPVQLTQAGSMIGCFFTEGPVEDYQQATRCDTNAFATFFGHMLDQGVILPPSQFETWFVSTAHDVQAIDQTIEAARQAFQAMIDSSR